MDREFHKSTISYFLLISSTCLYTFFVKLSSFFTSQLLDIFIKKVALTGGPGGSSSNLIFMSGYLSFRYLSSNGLISIANSSDFILLLFSCFGIKFILEDI